MNEKFLKPYNPLENEEKIYDLWESSGFFNPDICVGQGVAKVDAEPFSIVLPPPNVTGTLHIGHAAMLAIEDIMVRYNRMKGRKTLWLPGTDHAAIATQSKVEKELLRTEKKRRHDIGREAFIKKVEQFASESHDTIVNQIRRMGSSVDWSREAFTLDEKRSAAVRTAFKQMYEDGLIYRGHRIVNWDPKGQTTISDDEIVYREEKTVFYYFKYGPFIIGTSRPETKFGDKYVVMHPDDKRYSDYKHGDKIALEWINGPVTATIIKDSAVDMEFGSGVMTITPWHDTADFAIAERQGLTREQIIDQYGKLLPIAGEFAGMKIAEARPLVVEKLKSKGLLVKEEPYVHNVATAERTDGIIEPQIMEQWFVDVNKKITVKNSKITGISSGSPTSLKDLMLAAVKGGQIKILPERFEKIYFHWIENLRDWCISRQIWYGHRIPVWYRKKHATSDDEHSSTEMFVGVEPPPGTGWEQDSDTLDTWFSSGLWTFSTLGWPKKTKDLETYHPTSVLETGYDILFFWVARMILMSTYLLGEVPFKTVYLHGLVRDGQGRKMSKSLGNIIDPLDMIKKYGADATRLSLIIGTGPGNDSKLSEDKIRGYKNYANKIWNASRYVIQSTGDIPLPQNESGLTEKDRETLQDWRSVLAEITSDIEAFRFYLAGEKLYHYFWHRFADIVIEDSKPILKDGTSDEKSSKAFLLKTVLEESLMALHPFMPFVTESVWQTMGKKDLLMVQKWPL